jgi:chromosome partitioning protein
MGQVVTVMNMKGGVGKTTVTAHLAGMIATYKVGGKRLRVLAIDYDPQFNLSQVFLEPPTYFELEKQYKTSLAILQDRETDLDPFQIQVPGKAVPPSLEKIAKAIFKHGGVATLTLVPSTLDLMYIALGQSEVRLRPLEERFEHFIGECRDTFDLVMIDCHPAGSILTKTSLHNSDHVLIPVVPQRYAVRGIGLMMQFLQAKKLGHNAPTPHILFNLAPRKGIASEEIDIRANPRFADKCMRQTLRDFKAFREAADGTGFVWQSKKPWSTRAFQNLFAVTSEFTQRIGLGAL